jgi:hypothetical protein
MPLSLFFSKKKIPKIYKYMLRWPNHPIGGGWLWGDSTTPFFVFGFFFLKKFVGAFWE